MHGERFDVAVTLSLLSALLANPNLSRRDLDDEPLVANAWNLAGDLMALAPDDEDYCFDRDEELDEE